MSMSDELRATSTRRPGPLCVFQQIRLQEGWDRYAEIMDMLTIEGWSAARKQEVLKKHGYTVHRLTVDRHTLARMWEHNSGCVNCAEMWERWVEDGVHP